MVEVFFYDLFGMVVSVVYVMIFGKVVDVGWGIKFVWDVYWGNGMVRFDVE